MEIRETAEALERRLLSERAAFSGETRGRQRPEAPCAIRTAFQRDRDRILHCSSFRRLKHKTQVFLSPAGDHYRTRLTHTLEVSQIARTIARALRLNEDLTEAVALGHDLGHTPFGHAGERALQQVLPGGFFHYAQSLRVVDRLEKNGAGLNLTAETRDGIERHTGGADAFTLEGQIVRLADKIAYINHDIDDAQHAGILREEDIPAELRAALGTAKSRRINRLVLSCVAASAEGAVIRLGTAEQAAFDALHGFMFAQVYTNPICKSEEGKAIDMIVFLYQYFTAESNRLPEEYRRICETEGCARAAADYIAGMTDRFAVQTFEQCFIPHIWTRI
ncbi:MAG: deoxyguanosinetriphosphate triphosphohydrolase [Oscillospiraceae bacterium]|jgi:dGTPase|nr:deoxyguanosinetriphosphate triphosphohydrolase [Oscillospiraceae bacterium]